MKERIYLIIFGVFFVAFMVYCWTRPDDRAFIREMVEEMFTVEPENIPAEQRTWGI